MQSDAELLQAILRDRDMACPACHYNLRGLTADTCPECNLKLAPAVGGQSIRVGGLVFAIIPGSFSGICTLLLGGMVCASILRSDGPIPGFVFVLLAFGAISLAAAVVIFVSRARFMRQSMSAQGCWVLLIWLVHLLFFVVAALGLDAL